MTSLPLSQAQTDGRTVREIVESDHELVNEPWCRRVFRQILQSLEFQYAMQMPHRPISPDTVLILESGDPMLAPAPETDAPWSEADDMHDLAAVVFFAITKETLPAPPLLGSAPDGYSESFIAAIDRCLSPDPQQRPQDIEQLRNLLGIVPLGPAVPAQSFEAFQAASAQPVAPVAEPQVAHLHEPAQTPTPEPEPEPEPAALAVPAPALQRRWPLLAAAAAALLLALGALFALLRQADTSDTLTLALPQPVQPAPAQAVSPAAPPALVLAAPAPALQPNGEPEQLPAAPGTVTPLVRADVQSARQRQAAAAGGATYKLLIKPWGMIEVNGTSFGASPPLKRISLAPGQHTIRIANPNFPEHIVTVNAVKGGSAIIELDFTEEDSE
ncbi:hypothetical protein [Massilia sp. H6]|uniref:hypothetical protein n=1 Tax=Massilia sp. H6 TaxID=2970464 RepID=UPI0021695C85|nr:hypothetical protein [Massilia sp. H6]UVW27461.1 hypothetical protein NRS07_12975 [Massilia sp. H6]